MCLIFILFSASQKSSLHQPGPTLRMKVVSLLAQESERKYLRRHNNPCHLSNFLAADINLHSCTEAIGDLHKLTFLWDSEELRPWLLSKLSF